MSRASWPTEGSRCLTNRDGSAGHRIRRRQRFLRWIRRTGAATVGESALKQFARESVEETVKLESALAKLRTPSKVVLMHYAPILDTVLGEPREIFPFLGSSRLEEPVNRYGVTALFHGHAHNGTLEGKTYGGTPVFNVALPLLRKQFSGRRAIRFHDLPAIPMPVAS